MHKIDNQRFKEVTTKLKYTIIHDLRVIYGTVKVAVLRCLEENLVEGNN